MNTTLPNQTDVDGCVGLVPPYELSWVIPMLSIQQIFVTIPPTVVLVKMAYDKLDMAHPVFAVVFQELLVLLVCEMISLVSLLLNIFVKTEPIARLHFIGMRLAAAFHPASWLVISYLR